MDLILWEGADMQLLPASFRALEGDLGLSPTTLAASSLMQTLTCTSAVTSTLKNWPLLETIWGDLGPQKIHYRDFVQFVFDCDPVLEALRRDILGFLGRTFGQRHPVSSASAF